MATVLAVAVSVVTAWASTGSASTGLTTAPTGSTPTTVPTLAGLHFGLMQGGPVEPVTLASPGVVVTPGQNVPDPFVVQVDGLYYMFSSQGEWYGPNVPVTVSASLTSWPAQPVDALPTLPSWATGGFTWNPDVRKVDGRWVMWFNAEAKVFSQDQLKCIGVATAKTVGGPYVSTATRPQVCQLFHLGSIDPRTFEGPDGKLWLLWKSDDNANVNGTSHSTIYIQRLAKDGLSVVGQPTALMTADLPWEGRIVEAPDMVYAAGHYWLFFSGNWFNQPAYGIGVAECDSPTGPCSPGALGPWLSSNAQGAGAGEASLFDDGSRWWMLYAPFAVNFAQPWVPRPVMVARVVFGPDGPSVVQPETTAWDAPGSPSTHVGERVIAAKRRASGEPGHS
jgi:beta-xylosidase